MLNARLRSARWIGSFNAVIRVYAEAANAIRDARTQGRFSRAVTRFASLPNGFSPLKGGGHQREIDDRPQALPSNPLQPENLINPMCHDLCAEMRTSSSRAPPNFHVGSRLTRTSRDSRLRCRGQHDRNARAQRPFQRMVTLQDHCSVLGT
jgi:hypothetical protein